MQGFAYNLQQQLVAALHYLAPALLAGGAVFTVLAFVPGQSCNPGKPWWRNRELLTDSCYVALAATLGPYLSWLVAMAVALALVLALPVRSVIELQTGRGFFNGLPFLAQCVVFLIVSDFLLYWIHRLFHKGVLWPFHAIHHATEHVDWTAGYRMHPLNLMLGSYFVPVLMFYLGIRLDVIILLGPLDTAYSYFVHANLNWTLGPLKYVLATPVFHRWHHTRKECGGESNFAPTFAFWDVLFGTFYMPPGELPDGYGVDDFTPRGFLGQLVYPFKEAGALIARGVLDRSAQK